jgi:hypothetical protein
MPAFTGLEDPDCWIMQGNSLAECLLGVSVPWQARQLAAPAIVRCMCWIWEAVSTANLLIPYHQLSPSSSAMQFGWHISFRTMYRYGEQAAILSIDMILLREAVQQPSSLSLLPQRTSGRQGNVA